MTIFSGDARYERKMYDLHIWIKDLKYISHNIFVKLMWNPVACNFLDDVCCSILCIFCILCVSGPHICYTYKLQNCNIISSVFVIIVLYCFNIVYLCVYWCLLNFVVKYRNCKSSIDFMVKCIKKWFCVKCTTVVLFFNEV